MFGMLPFERRSDNNLFDVFDRFFEQSSAALPDFRTDIRELDGSYLLEAELPGFNKEDLNLELKDGVLTISATHKEESEEKDEQGNYLRRERRYGSYSRSFDVSGIDEQNISASYENGILKLTLPKAAPAVEPTRRIAIQ